MLLCFTFLPTAPMRSLITILASVVLALVLVKCAAASDNITSAMESSEQEALYSVIQGLVGKPWDGKQLYPDPCGWTAIQGVDCDFIDGLWRIVSLSFGPVLDNSLDCSNSSEIVDEIFRLTHLRSLSFFHCFTSTYKSIPATKSWSSLSSLTTLEFRSNPKLMGTLPSSLSLLTNLQSLAITESSVRGPIPPELGELSHLRKLVLAGNGLSDQIPLQLFHHMKELLILDLSRNSLTGSIPHSIGELTSLLKLDLSGNLIQGSLPEELGRLKALTLLDMRNNRVSGGVPNSLEKAASLQALLLSNNPLGGSISGINWKSMKALNVLDLSHTGIQGSIPSSIGEMKELRFLALDNNKLEGGVPMEIERLPDIGSLYLNGNNLTGVLGFSPEFVGRLGRKLAVWGNPNLCYNSAAGSVGRSGVPAGVNQCRGEVSSSQGHSNLSYSSNLGGAVERSTLYSSCGLLLLRLVVFGLSLDFGL